MKKITLILLFSLILLGCKNVSETDKKYNEIYEKSFKWNLGCSVVVAMFDKIIVEQEGIKEGIKSIDKRNRNLSNAELGALHEGKDYLVFKPTEKDIAEANAMIKKITGAKYYVDKIQSTSGLIVGLYEGGKKLERTDQIIKHSQAIYDSMDKYFAEVKSLYNEITPVLGIPLLDFLKQNETEPILRDSFEMTFPPLE